MSRETGETVQKQEGTLKPGQWLTASIPALWRRRQEDFHELETSLDCIVSSRPAWATE